MNVCIIISLVLAMYFFRSGIFNSFKPKMKRKQIKNIDVITITAADPGFPVGGADPLGGRRSLVSSDTGAFQRKRMRKRKNWVPLGGGGGIRHCHILFK